MKKTCTNREATPRLGFMVKIKFIPSIDGLLENKLITTRYQPHVLLKTVVVFDMKVAGVRLPLSCRLGSRCGSNTPCSHCRNYRFFFKIKSEIIWKPLVMEQPSREVDSPQRRTAQNYLRFLHVLPVAYTMAGVHRFAGVAVLTRKVAGLTQPCASTFHTTCCSSTTGACIVKQPSSRTSVLPPCSTGCPQETRKKVQFVLPCVGTRRNTLGPLSRRSSTDVSLCGSSTKRLLKGNERSRSTPERPRKQAAPCRSFDTRRYQGSGR